MPTRTITATAAVDLGDPNPDGVGTCMLQVKGGGTYSIVPKVWLHAPNGSLAISDIVNVAYKPLKTGTLTDGATTAITAAGAYSIAGDGFNVVLDITYTSGACTLDWLFVRG